MCRDDFGGAHQTRRGRRHHERRRDVEGRERGERSETFEIRGDETASFTADFTPVKRGKTGGYVLKPVADEVTVVYESTTTTS